MLRLDNGKSLALKPATIGLYTYYFCEIWYYKL
jgi:hypothetical protein